ncbi:hypothetical protein GCM10011349_44240 [Novosphingobium indicum]|uniref:PepSY domain-containing protein n=1 Tax=Novosphingobium indicum TaxID=462949 RepID=A0ABQ2JYW3_9SPHN|nr:PepSY-associated TM helix domain-containing protein [Novosphingobium indicum]GGN61526.1 hypothetical protein GCM10011349_44240 [Novosphingobium indicum]
MKARTAKSWKRLHRWLGVSLGLLWLAQGLTGALLVFHRELKHPAELTPGTFTALPPSRILGAARHLSGRPIDRLNASGEDARVVEARYHDAQGRKRILTLDAGTAKILDREEQDPGSPFTGSFWRWLVDLHVHILAGAVGELLVAASGVFLFASLCLGLRVAWPGAAKLPLIAKIRTWRSRPQRLYGWHRLVGMMVGPALAVVAMTGVYMAFMQGAGALFGFSDPFEARFALPDTGEARQPQWDADQAFAFALQRFPDGRLAQLQTPVERPGYYFVRLRRNCEWRSWAGRAAVLIDATSGRIVREYDPCRATWAHRLEDAVYPIHTGEASGFTGRVLVFRAGGGMVVIILLGAISWTETRTRKRQGNRTVG